MAGYVNDSGSDGRSHDNDNMENGLNSYIHSYHTF